MTKLLIFYLTDDRRHYTFPHFLNMLNKSKQKENWELLVLTHCNDNEFYREKLQEVENIKNTIVSINEVNNYMEKVKFAIQYAETNNIRFMMKFDNDVFLKSQVLDYMIDHLELLNQSNNLTLSPTITSGIPGVEYFTQKFLDEETREILNNIFLKTVFSNSYGADYSHLNKHTIEALRWDKNAFFNSVKNADYYYKGMHPIRLNNESLDFLNQYIIKNKKRFLEDHELKIIDTDESPYLCDNNFSIKTDIYKKIINDHSLFVDSYDEVPLNIYCWQNNMKHLFVENGFAIHMYYNWRSNIFEYEKQFCQEFFT
jgi:hypothetical protein